MFVFTIVMKLYRYTLNLIGNPMRQVLYTPLLMKQAEKGLSKVTKLKVDLDSNLGLIDLKVYNFFTAQDCLLAVFLQQSKQMRKMS